MGGARVARGQAACSGSDGRAEADDVPAELRKVFEVELPGVARMLETARLKARARARICGAG
jgi:hypothetical protein